MAEQQSAEFEALPLYWKLAASHDALMSGVSHIAINCHRTSGRIFGEERA